jgi:hypothetical protein
MGGIWDIPFAFGLVPIAYVAFLFHQVIDGTHSQR